MSFYQSQQNASKKIGVIDIEEEKAIYRLEFKTVIPITALIGLIGGFFALLLLIDFRETWKKGGALNTPKKLAVIALVLAIILSGAYSFISESTPQYEEARINTKDNPYPDAFTISFKATCNLGETHCNCVLDYLENNYSYSDFEKDSEEDDWRLIEANNHCKP